jgi:hypothetical protein
MQISPLFPGSRSPQPEPSPNDPAAARTCVGTSRVDPAVTLMRFLAQISPMSSPFPHGAPAVEQIMIAALAKKIGCSQLAIEEAVANLRAALLKEGDGPTEQFYVHMLVVSYLQLMVQIIGCATGGSEAARAGLECALERVRESRLLCHQVLRDCRAMAAGQFTRQDSPGTAP